MVNLLGCISASLSLSLTLVHSFQVSGLCVSGNWIFCLLLHHRSKDANNFMSCSNNWVYSSHYGINGDKQFFFI